MAAPGTNCLLIPEEVELVSTRSTVCLVEVPWVVGLHLYKEMLSGRYCLAVGRPSTCYPKLVIKLWKYSGWPRPRRS